MTKRSEQAARARAQIVTTAERLFASKGYDDTTLQAIADEAGTGKTNVYHYFRTKAEILDAALVSAVQAVHDLLAGAVAVPAGEPRVRFLLDGYVDLLVSRRHRQPWGLSSDQAARSRAVRVAVEQLTDRTAALVFDGPLTAPQRLVVAQLVALRDTVPRLEALDDDELRALLRAACDALLSIPGAAPSTR